MGYDLKWAKGPETAGDLEQRYTWRESAWTMGNLRALFDYFGMMDYDAEEVTGEVLEAARVGPNQDTYQALLGANDTGPIAWYKLCSNEGWIIPPDQCRELTLGIIEALTEEKAGGMIEAYAIGELREVHDYTRDVAVVAMLRFGSGDGVIIKGPPDGEEPDRAEAAGRIAALSGFLLEASRHGGFVVL